MSVYDKTGIVDFADGLVKAGYDIISSGGTARTLLENDITTEKVEELTGFPEILGGRVKTLHPKVHGGILYRRGPDDTEAEKHSLPDLNLVAVNLYPFSEVISKEHTLDDAVENIDIGGVALLRAAAKNHEYVTVVCNPNRYDSVLESLQNHDEVTHELRKELALEAFMHTAAYDAEIYRYLHGRYTGEEYPEMYLVAGKKVQDLRYGENPNQSAAFYHTETTPESSVIKAKKLHGKTLSYNNILDLDAGIDIAKDFAEPTVVAIKHTNPSGIASGDDLLNAYKKAYGCDPISIFGGIVAVNREVTKELAQEMNKIFLEAVIAPGFEDEAITILKKKKNLRIMNLEGWNAEPEGVVYAKVAEGLLVQGRNTKKLDMSELKVTSEREPTQDELEAMEYAWKAVKHVKSNAIVFARKDHTVGIGAGQMSRVDSVKIAHMKAQSDTDGCAMASDAFFPFRDAVDAAAEAGITAVIQPGGSIRDQEVIDAVNEHGMSMVFTGYRVFKH